MQIILIGFIVKTYWNLSHSNNTFWHWIQKKEIKWKFYLEKRINLNTADRQRRHQHRHRQQKRTSVSLTRTTRRRLKGSTRRWSCRIRWRRKMLALGNLHRGFRHRRRLTEPTAQGARRPRRVKGRALRGDRTEVVPPAGTSPQRRRFPRGRVPSARAGVGDRGPRAQKKEQTTAVLGPVVPEIPASPAHYPGLRLPLTATTVAVAAPRQVRQNR